MKTKKILWVFLSVLMIVLMFSMNASADLAQNTPDGATAMLYCVDENGNTLATYYYWGTSWTSFTETAPSITGYTPSQSTIKITHGLVYTKEYTLTYTRNSYKLTIYYKYNNGGTAASTYTASVKYGDSYSVSSPSVSGYTPSSYSIYGTMGTSDKTATVTYTPKNYTVTVNYQYANGKTAATSQSKSGVNGTSYSFTSPTISGYTPSQSVVSGAINGNQTITVTYTSNPVTSKYTLTINYVYSTGGRASSSYTSTMESGSSYSVSSPTISGYTADKTTVSGTLTSDKTVTVTYTKNQAVETPTTYTLTIYYKYDTGGTAYSTYITTLEKGSSYSIKSPSISGYTADISYVSGTLNANRSVTVYYSEDVVQTTTYTLTIYYKYASGGTAASTYYGSYSSGAYYSVFSPNVSGYSPDQYSVSGTLTSNKTITVYYYEDILEPATYTLTIKYVYGLGGKTAAPTYTAIFEEGETYSVSSPIISGYSTAMKVVSGTITGPTLHTVYYYASMVKQYTLTINYKYEDGTTAANSYTETMESGSTYSVTSPTITNYTANQDIISGTLTSDTTVTVTYSKNQYTLTINYKYADGTTAATTYTKKMDAGSTYNVSSPTITNYTASKTTVSGTLNGNVTETVTYNKNQYTLTIYYKYADGTTAVTTYTKKMDVGSTYNVSSPTITNYTASKTTVSGTLNGNVTETVTYSKNQYTLTIYYKYADGTTASTTYTKKMDVGTTYNVSSPSITNYTASKTTVSGTLNGNVTETVTYNKNQYTLTIYYKYADGTTAATTYTKKMNVGTTYNVSSPLITNYTASKTTVSGTLNGNVTETVTYNKNQYTLTIYYKYADGTTAATTYTKKMDVGSTYNVSSPTITNYHADKTSVSGTLNADTTVTVYYSKDQYTLTIYYKYTDGTTAATTYTGKMNVGSSYSVTSPTIEDYVADKTVVSGTLSGNKSVTVTYSVRTPDVSLEADGGSGNYTAGTTVISSFTVKNGAYNIKPFMNCDIAFRAYYIENGTQKTVATDTWDNFVIPKNEEGLVYFMWDVPESFAGKTVYCEISYGSQTMSFSKSVKAKAVSQVPNTRYETEKPSGFTSKSAGSASRGSAEWEIWEYEGGSYEKVKYTLSISADVEIKPDSNSFSAVYENGKWTMRSGYGYTISVKMNVSATSGADYTKGQCASAYLPEYEYSKTKNEYCTLELVDDTFQFATNTASAESARIVFMPVWYPDGGYTVKVVITDVWTPAGVVSVTGISNTITVSGTVFDDFYVGA